MNISASAPDVSVLPRIPAETIRRICVSLIFAEQSDLVRSGQMAPSAMAPLQERRLTSAELDLLRIDEDGLGFDSLARLGLILRVNRFFQLSSTGIEDYLLMHRSLGKWVALIGQHLDLVGGAAVFTFDTSGSAGPVKHISHHVSDLGEELRAHRRGTLADVKPGAQIIALVPPQHIYGFLFTCLLPALLGCTVVDLHRSAPTAVFRHARSGDMVIGTPLHWDLLQQTGLRLPPGIFGVTSAGPSSALTWQAPATLGLDRLIEIYGATETAGVGVRMSGLAPFKLLDHLHQSQAKITAPARGPTPLEVQDRLDWITADSFHVLGRMDDVIQIAGVNVSPSEICAVLQGLECVSEVAVRPEGNRLKAFVVPKQEPRDTAAFVAELSRQIHKVLPAAARPTSLTLGPKLPRNAMGKLCDWKNSVGIC